MGHYINVDRLAHALRPNTVNVETKEVRLAKIFGSSQEADLSLPTNCSGFGRIHHFRYSQFSDWPEDPLPISPASKYLGIKSRQNVRAQVFQLASCNFRCWYCFVPYSLLTPRKNNSSWITCDDIVEMYASMGDKPQIIDCSGGHPELAPEWVPWMMQSLIDHNLASSTFLWSDDNLSTYGIWEFLDDDQIELLSSYPGYARVGCFKGFDESSFSYNTHANPTLYKRQFDIFSRLMKIGIDLYAYVTFTNVSVGDIRTKMRRFVDRLQSLDANLPLRTVPLKILPIGVTMSRVSNDEMQNANRNQLKALEIWQDELRMRYSSKELELDIAEVRIAH